jgi:hypothetical protein
MEPVRSTTVIVNNTTVINQTVNITKIQVVNKRVINEGPRPEVIERKSGRKVEAIPVHELRRKEETEVVTRQRNIPSATEKPAQPLVRTESAPLKTVPAREPRAVEQPAEVTRQPQPPTARNEVRKPAPTSARPEVERPARSEGKPGTKGGKARSDTAPANAGPKVRQEAKPPVLPRETRQFEKPAEVTKQPQLPVRKSEVLGIGELKPSGTPARSAVGKPLGNERQRELQRVNARPETEQSATRKPTPLTNGKQIEKRKTPEKPAAIKPGEVKKKKDDKKKGEEQEKPPQQPPARP